MVISVTPVTPEEQAAVVNDEGRGFLPGHLRMTFRAIGVGWATATMPVTGAHMAINGYLHAGAVTSLADTVCATGCLKHLPEGAESFTTLELKANFLGTVRSGEVICEGRMIHGGRTTQVWDATVADQSSGRTLALFRATQLILYPR
jgi:uncharacterized protein (TIGR00369 family)